MANSLYDVPFYGGFLARRDQQAQEQLGDLQKANVLIGLKDKIESQRQDQALKSTMQTAGGTQQAIDALQRVGTPKAIELAHKLKGLLPDKPASPQLVTVPGPDGKPIQKWIRPGEATGIDIGPQYVAPKDNKISPLGQLIAERAALPLGDPRIKDYDAAIARHGRPGVDVTINNPGPMAPTKATATKVDEGLLDTTNRLMRLNQIETLYKPEFQELGTKFANMFRSGKAMLGMKMDVQERKKLTEFAAYRRNALENLNEYIRSVTGAVVNANEVPRLMGAMPNPGQGLFDGDDPVTFEAKKNDIIKMLRMGEARLAYIKRNGMSLDDGRGNPVIPLDQMPQLINQRGAELEGLIKKNNPSAAQKDIEKAVRKQLGIEFGLSSN